MGRKRYPLPRRFNAALTERAYGKLREMAAASGLGNNYVLTVLLENAAETIDEDAFERCARALKAQCD